MYSCLLAGNKAGTGGGALLSSKSCTVRDTVFTGNRAEGKGGGMVARYSGSSVGMRNITFYNNTATLGGGLHLSTLGDLAGNGTTETFVDCDDTWNSESCPSGTCHSNDNSCATVDDVMDPCERNHCVTERAERDNYSEGGEDLPKLSFCVECSFLANRAQMGAGMFFTQGKHNFTVLYNTLMQANHADAYGGAVFFSVGGAPSYSAVAFGVNFTGNYAGVAGPVVATNYFGTVTEQQFGSACTDCSGGDNVTPGYQTTVGFASIPSHLFTTSIPASVYVSDDPFELTAELQVTLAPLLTSSSHSLSLWHTQLLALC